MGMNERARMAGLVVLGLWAAVGADAGMAERAKGTFDVKVTPVPEERKDSVASGRITIEKTFHGDLMVTSRGEMWTRSRP